MPLKILTGAWGVVLFILCVPQCTQIEYNNPIDLRGTNREWLQQHPEALLDTNHNGIADYWDNPEYVRDTTTPVITLIEGDTVTILQTDPLNMFEKLKTQIKYEDAGGGPLTVLLLEDNVNIYIPNISSGEAYFIKYAVRDTSGNTGYATRYIWVKEEEEVDTVPPVISMMDTLIIIDSGSVYTDPGVTAYDIVDGKLTEKIISTGSVDVTKPGTYQITYTVTDISNNTATRTRTVIVRKAEEPDPKPVITLKGLDTIYVPKGMDMSEFIAQYIDSGYTALDTPDGDLTTSVRVSPIQKLSNAFWFITYDVTDNSGNAAATKQRIIATGLSEGTAPVIDLLPDPDSVFQITIDGKWVEPGYTATDMDNGNDLTSQVVVDSSDFVAHRADTGTYYIFYIVKGSSGIQTQEIRTVKVKSGPDTKPPVLTVLGRNPDSVLVKSAPSYHDSGCTAYDEHDGELPVTATGTVKMDVIGNYTISYSATDNARWVGRASRTVFVVKSLEAGNLFTAYEVPSPDPLPTMDKSYKTPPVIDGADGPDFSKFAEFKINWNLTNNQLNEISFRYTVEPYYKAITSSVKQTFSKTLPEMTLTGSGIEGLDGTYYVRVEGNEFYWVAESGKFALIWTVTP
ncbi:MAG: DUF5011 domain-containing protein [Chitinispirillaceae bacterium]|nr:DUF5011 domain-containing protein [Chitinispirillaceae bacterium]